ncbi:hypothetical protein AB0M46_39235 [Dactylosporangium sp. NPDC051485]|uniref:phosphorylase family protein n=1 Tax=Dactylosporangium sp. NPDC051485 TaxID=3154846 RepID=UPI003431D708
MTVPWEVKIADVVDGWLFTGDDPLPPTMIVPLENPHLFDASGWEVLGSPRRHVGLVAVHHPEGGAPVAVAKPVLGAAACAMLVDAASRRGVRTVIGVGYCGGTSRDLGSGTVIAASSAVPADGVSTAYAPAVDRVAASPRLLAAIGSAVPTGPVHSVAAVHLEDQRLVDTCASQGVLGIDMETASLYTVARVRGLDAVALLVMSDIPVLGLPTHVPSLISGSRTAVRYAALLAGGHTLPRGSAP